MTNRIKFEATKTYATPENAVKAVEKLYPSDQPNDLRYFIHCDELTGRFFPIFVGKSAVEKLVHFHFHVVM